MRELGEPTPAELAVWLRVCSPLTARGTCVWTAGPGTSDYGWFAYGGAPAITSLPSGEPVEFAFAAPDSWRLDGAAGPVALSDGRRSAVWKADGVESGAALIVLGGPSELLRPDLHDREGGSVAADELLGRACWRWEHPAATVWVDDATGCLLRQQGRQGDVRLTEVVFDEPLDPALFALPDDLPDPPPSGLPDRPARRPHRAPGSPGFSVPWWPFGAASRPVSGDPAVPEVLVELVTAGDGPTFWVGVAPAGRPAPVRGRRPHRRWDGEACCLSLSWAGAVPDDVLDRVVASMPTTWAPS